MDITEYKIRVLLKPRPGLIPSKRWPFNVVGTAIEIIPQTHDPYFLRMLDNPIDLPEIITCAPSKFPGTVLVRWDNDAKQAINCGGLVLVSTNIPICKTLWGYKNLVETVPKAFNLTDLTPVTLNVRTNRIAKTKVDLKKAIKPLTDFFSIEPSTERNTKFKYQAYQEQEEYYDEDEDGDVYGDGPGEYHELRTDPIAIPTNMEEAIRLVEQLRLYDTIKSENVSGVYQEVTPQVEPDLINIDPLEVPRPKKQVTSKTQRSSSNSANIFNVDYGHQTTTYITETLPYGTQDGHVAEPNMAPTKPSFDVARDPVTNDIVIKQDIWHEYNKYIADYEIYQGRSCAMTYKEFLRRKQKGTILQFPSAKKAAKSCIMPTYDTCAEAWGDTDNGKKARFEKNDRLFKLIQTANKYANPAERVDGDITTAESPMSVNLMANTIPTNVANVLSAEYNNKSHGINKYPKNTGTITSANGVDIIHNTTTHEYITTAEFYARQQTEAERFTVEKPPKFNDNF